MAVIINDDQVNLAPQPSFRASPYDSHPSTLERIELIDRMRIPYALDQENAAPVLDLFPNFEELQQELTAQLVKNVRR